MAGSWQISTINAFAGNHWIVLTQPIGFVIALIGLMGKLELPPFDSPEAETEIVAGPMTEYSGRGWALSVGLIALPYCQNTNPVLAGISRRATISASTSAIAGR